MTMATLCPSPELLRALSLGSLSQTESDDLFDHVKSCDDCQAELDTIHSNDDSLIEQLRAPDELRPYQAESNCQSAVARALGALAQVDRVLDDADQSHLPPRLGEYEIERRLGNGGMGSVYLGRHTKLGREVAIKILAHHRWHDPRVVERFEAEIKAIGRLAHPNIVSAYDAREVDGMAVLITEYVDGYDLGALLKRTGPLTTADACEIVRQTAIALEYTHAQGFVHRDVKPSNIMVSRLGHVKLLDLGLARLQFQDDQQPGLTGTGQTIGTADFIAPEQAIDGRSVDARADIYSLGCTLFKLLTGFAPFETKQHATAFAKMTAHVSTPAPSLATILPSLPTKLQQLVDAMMAKSPDQRPQQLAAVIEPLSEWACGANLSELVRRADATVPHGNDPRHPLEPASTSAVPTAKTWAVRRFPLRVLIATGFLSLGLGFLLGMWITIKYADGTSVKHQVPDGSEVTITPDESAAPASQPSGEATGSALMADPREAVTAGPRGEASDLNSAPMAFGIIDNNYPLSDQPLWVEIVVRLQHEGPLRRNGDGEVEISLDADEKNIIRWQELYPHISAMSTGAGLTLHFDGPLAERMKTLTESNLGKQLAIIVNGKVVAMPKIVSPVRDTAELSGLERDELNFLMQALNGLVEKSLEEPPKRAADPTTSSATPKSPTPFNNRIAAYSEQERDGAVEPLRFGIIADANTDPNAVTGEWIERGTDVDQTGLFQEVDGKFQVFVYSDEEQIVRWKDISSHLSCNYTYEGTYLEFQEPLASAMEALSKRNLGRSLAVILNGKVVAAPKIVAPMRKYAKLRPLDDAERHFLVQALNGAQNTPLEGTSGGAAERTTPTPATAVAPRQTERTQDADPLAGETALQPKATDPFAAEKTLDHLRQLALALQNHEATYQRLPASANTTLDGQPVPHPYSWRVAILPFLGPEEAKLFREYDFQQPWDSETNRRLLNKMPAIFNGPSVMPKPEKPGVTHYFGFVGDQGAFGKSVGKQIREFTDGSSVSILIFEGNGGDIYWTQPFDVPADNPGIFVEKLHCAMADGSVRTFDAEQLKNIERWITIAGNERIDP